MTDRTPEKDRDLLAGYSAEELIREFGGIRPMAAKLGVPVTTVQGWKSRGRIPVNRRQAILEAARNHNVDLSSDAERQPPKKPVTISSVPVSVEVSDAEELRPDPKPAVASDDAPKPESSSADKSASPTSLQPTPRPVRSAMVALLALAVLVGGVWLAFPGWFSAPKTETKSQAVTKNQQPPAVKKQEPPSQPIPKKVEAPTKTAVKPAVKSTPKSLPKPAPAPGVSEKVARKLIEEKTEDIGRRLAALSEQAGKLGDSDKALAEKVGQNLAQFRKEIAALRRNLSQISEKLATLKQPVPIQGEKIAIQALLLGQLETEIAAGRSYDGPLERLRKSLSDPLAKPALDGLAARAERGLPTPSGLAKRFRVLARKIALEPESSPQPSDAEGNFQGWLKARLKGLISVRRVGGSGSIPPLSKAEAAMSDSDFARAADHLEKSVPQAASNWVAPWIEDARAYASAQKNLEKLRWHVSALLRKKAAAK